MTVNINEPLTVNAPEDKALAESAGYAADKERMDWLEATRSHLNYATMYQDWYVQKLGQVTGNIGRGKTAREAIDAARHISDYTNQK